MEISISGTGLHSHALKRRSPQLLRVMKLTALLLIVGCLHVSATSYSQTVSFSGKNVPLNTVFSSIEKQTGLSFFFNYALIKNTKPVTLNVQDIPLEEALNQILKGEGLDFYRTGKTIFIVKRQAVQQPLSVESTVARSINVKGRVTNHLGENLVSASVSLKNGKKATLTNEKGEFELKNIPESATLEISYLGYQKKEVQVDGKALVMVQLNLADNQLDETQVIAYGQTSQRLSVGNVSLVKAEEIEKQPVNNPLLALQGRVPGLFITQNNGLPGGGLRISLQGLNSLLAGNDPFYVIDGVPYPSQLLPNIGSSILTSSGANPKSGLNSNGGNPLSFINPYDIESISILKDADATAIYGSRAANGAILITTKKGKAGLTKVNINFQSGIGQVARKLELMNTRQYLEMRREAILNDKLSVQPTDYDINGVWDTTKSRNWQKELIGKTSKYSDINVSASGGNPNTQYFIGGTYHFETSVFPGNFSDKKGSLHFNINNISPNQKFRIQLSGNYQIDFNELPISDFTTAALAIAPDAPNPYNSDGSINWSLNSAGSSTWFNPFSYLYNTYSNKTSNLVSNIILSYQISRKLDLKCNAGYTNLQSNEVSIYPLVGTSPQNRPYTPRSAQYSNNNISSWIVEPQITYKTEIGKGNIEGLIGSTLQNNNSNGQIFSGSGFNNDQVLKNIASAASITVNSSLANVYKYNALFGRINYNYARKYLIEVAARRDGSSRFGSQNQFHNFGAIGLGWIFSEEVFSKKVIPFLSFGKFKGSLGTTGNDQIGDYKFLSLYAPRSVNVPYQQINTLSINSLSNPYLQWEETKKIQVGLDLGFLNDRILLNSIYFRNRSSNLLQSYSLPSITGFSSITENYPATIQNSGWEFSLNTKNISGKVFKWSSAFNISIPRNKLISFQNLATSSAASTLVIGQPITITKVFNFYDVNPATGVYQFIDNHGSVTSTPVYGADQNVLVNIQPKFYGGLQNHFEFKDFQFDFLFQFVKQVGIGYSYGRYLSGLFNTNQPTSVLNRWRQDGDIKPIQRFNSNYTLGSQYFYYAASNAAITDASFIRLKNISISYQLSQQVCKKAHINSLRVYLQGQNLLTITKYYGFDPENQSTTALPPLRIVTAGFQVGL